MVLEPIYLDLSSSDDDDDDRNRAGSTALLYLSKVLHVDADDDDDDDVRIIDKPARNCNVRRERARVISSSVDDDDCCILDADPGADAAPDIVSSVDTDELVMTGEKGPVACRDFPHARYLCVHFPFKTTGHSKSCAQCHCYVCDSLAPCSMWGDGNNVNDHCHASEEPRWKTLRKVAKCGSVPPVAADPTGGSRLVQSSISQHASTTPPVTQSSVVDSGASHKLQAAVKRDPLVIKLTGKGRGKLSQPPHLGVRPSRSHRILPLSSFPGQRSWSHPRRSTSTPSGRVEEVQPAVLTAARSPQPTSPTPILEAPHYPVYNPHPSRSTSTSGRLEEVELAVQSPQPIDPNPGPRRRDRLVFTLLPSQPRVHPLPDSGRASTADILAAITRSVGLQPMLHPDATSCSPFVSSPVPSPPPSLTSPPPSVTNDVSVLQPPGADAAAPDFVSPAPPNSESRYIPASDLTNQEVSDVNMDLSTSCSESVHQPIMVVDADNVAQDPSPVNSASFSHTVDILAGSIEGWEVDAAMEFDAFAAGINDTKPEQVTTSLNDVLQQMAGDDYLWEQFPSW